MAKLTKILRGSDPVSETEANAVFDVLIPVVEKVPRAPEAVAAAKGAIGRCVLDDDRPLAHVLDWWFVVTTGETTANNGAHLLPGALDARVRIPMATVMELKTELPRAEWMDKRRQFDSMLEGLDDLLRLDSHGAVKLPGERAAWQWFIEALKSPADALAADRKAPYSEIDWKKVEQRLRESGIEQGSRRYRETRDRCREAANQIDTMVGLQHQVEPWIRQRPPELLGEVPVSVEHAVGRLAKELLRPVLSAVAAPDVDTAALVERINEAARGADRRGRYRLARVIDRWCEETGHDVPALAEETDRHRSVALGLSEVQNRPGVSEDEIVEISIHVEDDDISAAEKALERLRTRIAELQLRRETRAQFEGLRRKLAESDLSEDSDWRERLQEVESRVESEDPQQLTREIGAVQRELSQHLDEIVHGQQEQLREQTRLLAPLGAPDSQVREYERAIDDLERRGGRGASELKARIESTLRDARAACRDGIANSLEKASRILAEERGDFPSDVLGAFLNRRADIETLMSADEISEDVLIEAREDAATLLEDLEDQRVHRWRAEDGEASLLNHILSSCQGTLDFDDLDVKRLYVSLKTRPFAILAGVTGSGKSSLTRTFAAALGANSTNRRFRRIAVRPDWIDQSEVLGYVNPVSGLFVPGWLAETMRDCEHAPDRLHFVLLDEMNLAPVEQYLAEWLSALEEARSGSTDVRLPLYSPDLQPENAGDWPPRMSLPGNLIIIGTVNVDETTRPLSERVLDRANVLLLSVEVSDRHHKPNGEPPRPWHVGMTEWEKVCTTEPSDKHHEFLTDVANVLRQANIGVGLRAHVELERFVANAEGILDAETALDWGIVQRIIPKTRGFKGHLTATLSKLLEEFEGVGARQSASILSRWLDDRVSDDEFLDGTDPRLALARIQS